jgi:DNA gyrase/topoisomerase IV subunit B
VEKTSGNAIVPVFYSSYEDDNAKVEFAFKWIQSVEGQGRFFTNGIEQTSGGTHVQGFMHELKSLIESTETKKSCSLSALKTGLVTCLHITLTDPQYSSQTKERLTSTIAKSVLRKAFKESSNY